MDENTKKEKKVLYEFGLQTLDNLKAAKDALNADLFGGSFLTKMKHNSNRKKADSAIEQAKIDLLMFSKEVNEINKKIYIRYDEEDYLKIAQKFFESSVKDLLTEEHLKDCKHMINSAIYYTEVIVAELK